MTNDILNFLLKHINLVVHVFFYVLSYFLGAVAFGHILAKRIASVDIQREGSKSIGATNVWRVVKTKDKNLGKKLAALTLFLDTFKGIAPIFLAYAFDMHIWVIYTMAVLSVIGHCFSPFLKFEGGKGVATGFGVLLAIIPVSALIGAAFWVFGAKVSKISSIGSLLGLVGVLVSFYIIEPQTPHSWAVLIAIIVVYKHLPNIYRLLIGKEKKAV